MIILFILLGIIIGQLSSLFFYFGSQASIGKTIAKQVKDVFINSKAKIVEFETPAEALMRKINEEHK